MDTKLLDHHGLPIETKAASAGMGALDREFFYSQAVGAISAAQVQKQPFQYHAWTYACAYAIAMNICRMHLYLYYKDKPNDKIIDHEILDLFRSPNPLMTRTSFIDAIILNLLLSVGGKNGGQCFIICDSKDGSHVNLSRGEMPIMLTPVNDRYVKPDMLILEQGGYQVPRGWLYDPTGRSGHAKSFKFNEIIRIYQFNPYDILKGVANEQPARIAILQDVESDIFNERLYTNMAVPAGIIKTDKRLTKEQKRDILSHWYETNGGPGNNNRTAIMDEAADYKHIGLSNADMQFTEAKDFMKEQVIAAFHLNKIALGDYEQINRATIEVGRRMLWNDVYLPLAELILEAFNSPWIQYVDKGLRLGFDHSHIEALRDDYTSQATASKTMVDAGMPPLIAFKINGIPLPQDAETKFPWMLENPFTSRVSGLPAFGQPAAESPVQEQEGKHFLKFKSSDDREAYWRGYISKAFDPGEKSVKVAMIDYFNKQRNQVQDNIDKLLKGKAVVKAVDIDVEKILFDKKAENDRLKKVLKPLLAEQSKRDSQQLSREGIAWKTNDKKINEYIAKRAEFIEGMNDLTFEKVKEKVNQTIKTGLEENKTPQEIARDIKDDINEEYETRKGQAQTIARTEIGAISSENRFDAFDENGVEYIEWVTAMDEKVRDSHIEQGSEGNNIIPYGEVFDVVNLHYPCESGGEPEEVINCRCVAVAVLGPNGNEGPVE